MLAPKLEINFMKFNINNIEFQNFDNILFNILFIISELNEHVPLKQKHLRANNTAFITEDMENEEFFETQNEIFKNLITSLLTKSIRKFLFRNILLSKSRR